MPESRSRSQIIRHLPKAVVLLFVALLFACGSSATATPVSSSSGPLATSVPRPTSVPSVAGGVTPTPIPTAAVQATKAPAPAVKFSGTINYGVKETGVFEGHPRFISSPRYQYMALTAGESMVTIMEDFSPAPFLAVSWSISDDFLVWTWKIRDDVEFHKGYGLLTIDDVLYSFKEYHDGALNARAGIIGDYWVGNKGGSQTVIDDFTVEVNTGEPWIPARAFEFMRGLGGLSTSIVSKKQSEELTPEVASKDIAMTGPWEIDDFSSGEFWRFKAVQDHWRQTPFFEEFVLWTIPEESARVAGFQTGNLDTFQMSFDTLPTVDAVPGSKVVAWANAGQAGLNIYGQTYGTDKDGNPYEALDCSNAWVSCDEDPDSVEWANAVKVKRAMSIAIDRQTIVDTLLSGFGNVLYMRDWMGHEAKADPRWVFLYDPEAAKQLLVEAGYPNGFTITLTPAIRGAPAEVEACEAVAQYWEDIGISVKIQNVPYATIRPSLITRQYQGVTCHTVGARLNPIIGASNYVKQSTFSYGTEHPWMEEHISAALLQVDPVKLEAQTKEIYGWMYDNVMAFALYAFDGLWPIGPALDPEWTPYGFSEVRTPSGFEYIKHR
ncbi:MAG: ABC transporter substrate-binding protein [Chloroflexi bacterium]|nr:ABC transporter substrate-binding protein [Chloroflexota bacterium]